MGIVFIRCHSRVFMFMILLIAAHFLFAREMLHAPLIQRRANIRNQPQQQAASSVTMGAGRGTYHTRNACEPVSKRLAGSRPWQGVIYNVLNKQRPVLPPFEIFIFAATAGLIPRTSICNLGPSVVPRSRWSARRLPNCKLTHSFIFNWILYDFINSILIIVFQMLLQEFRLSFAPDLSLKSLENVLNSLVRQSAVPWSLLDNGQKL